LVIITGMITEIGITGGGVAAAAAAEAEGETGITVVVALAVVALLMTPSAIASIGTPTLS
jgi:hypothetical protein